MYPDPNYYNDLLKPNIRSMYRLNSLDLPGFDLPGFDLPGTVSIYRCIPPIILPETPVKPDCTPGKVSDASSGG